LPRSSEKPLFQPVKLTALLDGAVDALRGRAAQKQVVLDLDVEQPAAMVAEAEGRCALAVRTLVDAMIDEAPASSNIAVIGAVENGHVRVLARTPQGRKLKTKSLAAIVHPIGGDAGSKHTGEASEAWVKLPRA
jgi:signal transduction histidine kinase